MHAKGPGALLIALCQIFGDRRRMIRTGRLGGEFAGGAALVTVAVYPIVSPCATWAKVRQFSERQAARCGGLLWN